MSLGLTQREARPVKIMKVVPPKVEVAKPPVPPAPPKKRVLKVKVTNATLAKVLKRVRVLKSDA